MKNKYFILVLTFLSLLIGQSSYAQDWQDMWDATEDGTNSHWESNDDGGFTETDFYNSDLEHYETNMNDQEYNDWLASGGWEDQKHHSQDDMKDKHNQTNDHYVDNIRYNDSTTDISGGLLDTHNYENYDNWGDDDQYPPGDTPNNNDTGTPEEPTKPEDCPTANCSKTQKIKAGTCDCEKKEKNWYLDNDGDGYDSGTYTGERSPGPNWKEGTSKGVDCDDSRYSDTNACADIDPCAEIKKQLADAKFKEMIAGLKDPEKLKLNYETGYYQDKAGSYKPMEVYAGEPGVFVPYGSGGYQNTNHVHTKQFIDANGVVNQVFPMPSPRDIATIYTDYNMSRQIGTDPGNNYTGTINSLGYFQLRYTGQSDNLPFDQLKGKTDLIDTEENWDKFKALAKEHDNMIGFLIFMRDILKIKDIALYKVDDTGAKKIELDANNQIKEIPCNK